MRLLTHEKQRAIQEIRYIHLVFAFIGGKSPPWDPPIPGDYGIDDDRAHQIIAWALIAELADLNLGRSYGYGQRQESGVFTSASSFI